MTFSLRAAPPAPLVFLCAFLGAPSPSAQEPKLPIVVPADARTHGLESLHERVLREGVPTPAGLATFVKSTRTAQQFGKALFYDMAVGSDGVQACASCHFHAGADSRTRNQANPGLNRVRNARDGDITGFAHAAGAADTVFQGPLPNQEFLRADFPFVRDIGNGANVVDVGGVLQPAPGNSNDVASSMGVRLTDFVSVAPGVRVDQGIARFDPVFSLAGRTVRRVEPRNTPTMINAVFNFFNFWDGRASPVFNGVNPFGLQDPSARVFRVEGTGIVRVPIALDHASLASQAVGPPLSFFEMSFGNGADNGRTFRELGRKLLATQALAAQDVASDDSLLGALRHPSGKGLTKTYGDFVRAAFAPQWWSSAKLIYFPPTGDPRIVDATAGTDPARTFTLMEANFALFYGLAVQAYESTLIADRAPFDRWMEGNGSFVTGFGASELAGLNLFASKGRCLNCHGGPEFTNASVHRAEGGAEVIEPMLMGDGRAAVYDNGFYNIGVTPTSDDIGRGGSNPFGQPLSSSRQLLFEVFGLQSIPFEILGAPLRDLVPGSSGHGLLGALDEGTGQFLPVCLDLDHDGRCGEADDFVLARNAVDGAFKAPSLRNAQLTGPYFHDGSMATLMEVVEFYDRGGNFCRINRADLDPDIEPIGLGAEEKRQLVSFLLSLTDARVPRESAPFDHPSIPVPHGTFPDGTQIRLEVPAVGAGGLPTSAQLTTFLGASPFEANPVTGERDSYGDVACGMGHDDR
jgi:cytochrome c peroxidase